MKRLRLLAPHQLELVDEPLPEVRPGMVRVRVLACGICGSDVALFNGHRDLANERYFGHEFTGVVTAVGPGVPDLKEGMRVASGMVRGCGRCWNCRNGHPNYCRSLNDVLLPGGFAEETLVEHTDAFQFLSPLPEEVDSITGTLTETIGCVLRLVERAELKPGQSVLAIGLGAIGALTAALLKSMGAGVVVGMDVNPLRLRAASRLRLDRVIDRNDPDWLEQVRQAVGPHGADLVIEATGVPGVLADAFSAARLGGRVVVGSVYHGLATGLDLLPIMRKELTVVGAKGSFPYVNSDDRATAVKLLASGVPPLDSIFGLYTPEQASEAFRDAAEGRYIKPVIRFDGT